MVSVANVVAALALPVPLMAAGGLNGSFERFTPGRANSAMEQALENAGWTYSKPLVLPDQWRPNPRRKNGAFRYDRDNPTEPHGGKYCIHFTGDVMSEFFFRPTDSFRRLSVRFWSRAVEPGAACVYMYGDNYAFLGELSRGFPASAAWQESKLDFGIPTSARQQKVLFCVIALKSGASGCAIDDVEVQLRAGMPKPVATAPVKVAGQGKPALAYGRALEQGENRMTFADCKLQRSASKAFAFTQKDADSRQVRFALETHFDWTGLGGWAPGLAVHVNGTAVTGVRLLNKPLTFRVRNGAESRWAAPDGASFLVMYSKDFTDTIKTDENYEYGLYEKRQEPYRYVFDLSGLTQHVGENIVTVTATMLPIIVRNICIEFDDRPMPRINDPVHTVTPAPTGELADFTLRTPEALRPVLRANSSGALVVGFGDSEFGVSSRFSLPGGRWLETDPGEKARAVSLPYEKTWTAPEYTITRRIAERNGHVKVVDTFTNLTDRVVGVMFENAMRLPEAPAAIHLGGRQMMLTETRNVTNPTAGAALAGGYAALVLEDDVLRNQAFLRQGTDVVVVGDRNLGLPPAAAHSLAWSIYYVPGGGYYDMINAVRRDWGSNFTLDGPFSFPYGSGCENMPFNQWDKHPVTEQDVRDFLARRPVKVVITHVPGNYAVPPSEQTRENPFLGHGTGLFDPSFEWWCNMTRAMTEGLEKYAPGVRVHAYLHKNLCTERGNRGKYKDSVALDATSRKLSGSGIAAYYQPTLNNSYGKRLKDVYEYLVEDIGASIYMDEICLSVTVWEKYSEWDNCTVTIDLATHAVTDTISIPNLLVRPWLEEMIAVLESRDRKLIANGPPATRTLHDHHAMHFVEQGMGSGGLLAAQLSTPLAFCYHHGTRGFVHFRDALQHGFLCFVYSGDWSGRVFPFTPVEIRPGYIICRERIVTSRSGVFGWGDRADVEFFVYDGTGQRTDGREVRKIVRAGDSVFEVRMPSDHIAIIVRE